MSTPNTTHIDWAEDAEAAEHASNWAEAAKLWQRAADACGDDVHANEKLEYVQSAAACRHQATIDSKFREIAQNILGTHVLDSRLKLALRAAYEFGRVAEK